MTGNLTGGTSTTETSTTTMAYNTTPVSVPGGTTTAPNTLASVIDDLGNGTSYAYADTAHHYEPTSISKMASGSTVVSTTTRLYQDVSDSGGSAYGLLQQETLAAGTSDAAVCQYTHNGNGFLTSKTEATGTGDPSVVTNYTYDLRGELTSETNASSGRSTTYTYDGRGNRTGVERYDEWKNLVSWNFATYNQNGEVEWEQGPRYSPNDYVYRQYDGAGR